MPLAQAAIHSVVPGGKVISVGMGCDHAHVPISTLTVKEIDLMGSFRYANTVRAPPAGSCCLLSACDPRPRALHPPRSGSHEAVPCAVARL